MEMRDTVFEMRDTVLEETKARLDLQHRYDDLRSHYNGLYDQYQILHGQQSATKAALEDAQSKLYTNDVALTEELNVRKAVETQLVQARGELRDLEKLLKQLYTDIEYKDANISSFHDKIKAHEHDKSQNSAILKENEAKTAEVARLKGTIMALEVKMDTEKEPSTTSTLEIANTAEFVTDLETQVVSLEKEMSMLRNSLDESQEMRQHFQDESCAQNLKLESVKTTLLTRYPELHNDLSNLSEVLTETGSEKRSKKRKTK